MHKYDAAVSASTKSSHARSACPPFPARAFTMQSAMQMQQRACTARATARLVPRTRLAPARAAAASSATLSFKDAALIPVMQRGEMTQFPGDPGVYAIFAEDGALQYIGLSRKASRRVGFGDGAMGRPWKPQVVWL